ncbi:MAG: coproporphyrinogen III oxidase, partial [Verrucomicrobia bacterium]|nr:coproporphyrinogen III oxidase [Cytophagales bacterium]
GNWTAKNKFTPVTEDFAATQFEMLIDFLEKNDFEQYEISNFSLSDFHARHNSNYWKQQPYLGVGPSAHSYNGFSRQWNVAHNQQYIKSITEKIIPATIEILSENDRINEYVMTGLRTKWGINVEEISQFSNLNFLEKNIEIVEKYKNQGLLTISENNLILTKKGKLLADRIASDLFM